LILRQQQQAPGSSSKHEAAAAAAAAAAGARCAAIQTRMRIDIRNHLQTSNHMPH
jgi:hypothetical protein